MWSKACRVCMCVEGLEGVWVSKACRVCGWLVVYLVGM